MTSKWLVSLVAVSAVVVGCSEDKKGTAIPDGGVRDVGGSTTDTGLVRDTGPRTDAGVDAGGTDRNECDPFTAGSCDASEKCSVVIDRTDEENIQVFFGCVSNAGAKGEGVICSGGRDATPADEDDSVSTDDCRQGLFCWDVEGESVNRCQGLCGDGAGTGCGVESYCEGLNSEPAFGVCKEGDNCDVVAQTGCEGEDGCYLIANDTPEWISSCFPFNAPDGGTGAAGEECTSINVCAPGTLCQVDRVDGGTSAHCRAVCNPVGADMDAGVPCAAETACEAVSTLSDGGVIRAPGTPGVCWPAAD